MKELEEIKDRSPEDVGDLDQSHAKTTAAGMRAIGETMKHAFGKMGVVRGTRSLLALNQKGGIDCQSCAWPDPDEDRTVAEFCESGAKALADEGTKKKIGREFFAKHSIAELSQHDDRWLNSQGRITEPLVRRKGSSHYDPIEWPDAFNLIADELNTLA